MTLTTPNLSQTAREVIEIESQAVKALEACLNDTFEAACNTILNSQGRTIVMGMGKSGHIAKKIAATLASTGTPSFFIHPAEARHGDMGMITSNDVLLILSNSGETDEVTSLLPQLKQLKLQIIAVTSNNQSTLAKSATLHLALPNIKEACPLDLAPTTSTTMMLVMGDAIAITLLKARGLTHTDFARFHPGGSLGKRLTLTVQDKMHQGIEIPKVQPESLLANVLMEITQKRLGMTAVIDEQEKPIGIYTDGDIRRSLAKEIDIHQTPIKNVMTTEFKTTSPEVLLFDALQTMEEHKITTLLVTNNDKKLVGVIHLHDILGAL